MVRKLMFILLLFVCFGSVFAFGTTSKTNDDSSAYKITVKVLTIALMIAVAGIIIWQVFGWMPIALAIIIADVIFVIFELARLLAANL